MLNVQHSPVSELELTAVFGVMVVSKHVPGSAEFTMEDAAMSLN